MVNGLIPDTLVRLHSINFTENEEYRMMKEEDERSFLEWCKSEDEQPKQSIYGLPSRWAQVKKEGFYRTFISQLIP